MAPIVGPLSVVRGTDPAIGAARRIMDEAPQPALSRLLFGLYKSVLSPAFHAFSPSQCKYLPTCSEYAYVAFVRFGPLRGSWLALRRLARCHPFAKGGLDPVPPLPTK